MNISKPEAVNIITRKTRGGFFGIEFVKKDGSTRRLNARLGVRKGLAGGKNTVDHKPEYLTVWSRHDHSWRNVNVNTIRRVTFGGVEYEIAA